MTSRELRQMVQSTMAWTSRRPKYDRRPTLERYGYKSGLEATIAQQLTDAEVPFEYEAWRYEYEIPASMHYYTPDYFLGNGIIVETKGYWAPDDRKKMALIKDQWPDEDIRMLFSNSRTPIRKGSKTTYGDVATKLGIPFADKTIPPQWLN